MTIKEFPTLYKTTSTGAEQQWDIRCEQEGDVAVITTLYGQVGGAIQEAKVVVSEGKNLGRKNATTAWTQSMADAESKWKKQLDKGYSEQRGGAAMTYKPMLAHKLEDCLNRLEWPSYVQCKYDGCRCIAVKKDDRITLYSRQGKKHVGLKHIVDELQWLMNDGDVWDGELYNHDLTFQQTMSLIKKDQPDSVKVQYHIYDVVCEESSFLDRFERIREVSSPTVIAAKTYEVESLEETMEYHSKFLVEGYEGSILRVGDCMYRQGYRSRQLLKIKDFKDDEFEIVDVVNGKGRFETQGVFRLKTQSGTLFDCVPMGDVATREGYLNNRQSLIGKMLTVRYFELTTSENPVPRFPVGVAVREEFDRDC